MFAPFFSPGRQNLPGARRLPRMVRRWSPGKMTRLLTPPTSSPLAQLHPRRQPPRRPVRSPQRCNTSGIAREDQVPGRRRGHQTRAIRELGLTEVRTRTQTRHITTPTGRRRQRASHSSTTSLDKMALAQSARTVPFLRLLSLVLVLLRCRE
jgi:hypothetical protein